MGGLPRKCFKKLIKKELDKQCMTIFNNLMNCQEVDQPQPSSEPQVVHQGVDCDGCNRQNIPGVRYKCSVCKNFDYCAMCEERKKHDHPFLKICNPRQAPKALFTVIDETMPNAHADIEQDIGNPGQFRNNANRCGGGWRG